MESQTETTNYIFCKNLYVKYFSKYKTKEFRIKKRWFTRITSHSIYAVVGMPYTAGALAAVIC